MITQPNYTFAEKTAFDLLEKHNILTLPVSLKDIYNNYDNLMIISYSEYAKKHKLSLDDIINSFGSADGCCHYRPTQRGDYIILYNDCIENSGRIRWTIAHELGHYFLKHNEITGQLLMARNSMSESEYSCFEKEADCFARTLLAPPPVLIELGAYRSPYDLMNLCNISYTAATNSIHFISNGFKRGITYCSDHRTSLHFKSFIHRKLHSKTCVKCNYYFTNTNVNHCLICGGNNFIRRESKMLYNDGVEMNEHGLVKKCPNCENEQLSQSGDYCNICGTFTVNMCSGINGPYTNAIRDFDNTCKTYLNSNARYCHICGSESTFFRQNLLLEWQNVKKADEEAESHKFSSTTMPF
ncbi:ImmA/IrrE family metallo-endopeptidase [Bacillus mycoides]|uniref:ImmA/IrrE family metallo-endopeptidase n=1 Tax=Bacillus mycoides TaxID=1405 RepID=UPI003F7C93D3